MSDVIIVAIITGTCSVIGQWLISRKSSQEKAVADAVRDARLEDRLKSVESKLDEHNGYAKKFEDISKDIAVIKVKLETLKGG